MPVLIKDLLHSRQELTLISVKPDDPIEDALKIMSEKDFSQLPVLDSGKNFLGLVTNKSILDALRILKSPISSLRVSHALIKTEFYFERDELSKIFDELRAKEAVIVQSEDSKEISIVTTYDMAEYFRRKAENLILLKDIEITLKDHIESAFPDEIELAEVVEETSRKQAFNNFKKAIKHYESLKVSTNIDFDQQKAITEVFEKNISDNRVKSLDDLTLNNFIEILLHSNKDDYCKSTFALDKTLIHKLLVAVRDIRNDIFHFRRDFRAEDNRTLHFCSNWLVNHPPLVTEMQEKDQASTLQQPGDSLDNYASSNSFEPEDSCVNTLDGETRYSRLSMKLKESSSTNKFKVDFTLSEIEKLINDRLPTSARQNRSWWINDETQPWVSVGWYVSNVDMSKEKVTFIYKPNGNEYIKFFDSLLTELKNKASFSVRTPIQDGRNYITFARLPEKGKSIATLTVSFSYAHRSFRIEMFINSDIQEKNKAVFEFLQTTKESIEREVGHSLVWEPRKEYVESRISLLYPHKIVINDEESSLEALRNWAVDAMIKFQEVMAIFLSRYYELDPA